MGGWVDGEEGKREGWGLRFRAVNRASAGFVPHFDDQSSRAWPTVFDKAPPFPLPGPADVGVVRIGGGEEKDVEKGSSRALQLAYSG